MRRAAAGVATGPWPTRWVPGPASRRAAWGAPRSLSAATRSGTRPPTADRWARRSRHPPGNTRRARSRGRPPGRRRRGKHRDNRDAATMKQHQAGGQSPGKPSEPAQSAAGKEQVEKRPLSARVLDRPHELRPRKTADDAGYPRVNGCVWQPRPSALAIEEPKADDRSHSHKQAETRDLELADAKHNGTSRPRSVPATAWTERYRARSPSRPSSRHCSPGRRRP